MSDDTLGTSIYPPTPADARGSAPGNNTFDPGFGPVPLRMALMGVKNVGKSTQKVYIASS